MDLADYVDDTATLFGIAENAAAGAVLRCGAFAHVYIDGLPEWDDSDLHAAFEVTGTLVEEGSEDRRGTGDGTLIHSLGKHYVMRNATWERVS